MGSTYEDQVKAVEKALRDCGVLGEDSALSSTEIVEQMDHNVPLYSFKIPFRFCDNTLDMLSELLPRIVGESLWIRGEIQPKCPWVVVTVYGYDTFGL